MDFFFMYFITVISVQARHHFVLRHGCKTVKIDALKAKFLPRMSWDQDVVLLGADREFYENVSLWFLQSGKPSLP